MRLTYGHTRAASYVGYVTQAIVNNLAPLLFVTFERELGLTTADLALLISMNFLVQIAVDLAAARFADTLGYRAVAAGAHLISAAGLICLGILPRALPNPYVGLIAAVALSAVGGGMIEVIISPIVESLPGDQKAASMSLLHSFYCWGHVAVVILSTVYFALFGLGAWPYLAMAWAAVPMVNFLLFLKVPLRTLKEAYAIPNGRERRLPGLFALFFLLMICAGAAEQAMSQWASLFAETGLHVSKTLGDLMGPCLFAALMGLARVFYGIRGAKLHLHQALLASGGLCVLSYLTAVFSPWPLIALLGCGLCGLSVGLMWPGTFSLASRRFPFGGTAMFALLALAGDVGCSAGPGLVGFVADAAGTGLKTGMLFAILFPVALLALVFILWRSAPGKKEEAAP